MAKHVQVSVVGTEIVSTFEENRKLRCYHACQVKAYLAKFYLNCNFVVVVLLGYALDGLEFWFSNLRPYEKSIFQKMVKK